MGRTGQVLRSALSETQRLLSSAGARVKAKAVKSSPAFPAEKPNKILIMLKARNGNALVLQQKVQLM